MHEWLPQQLNPRTWDKAKTEIGRKGEAVMSQNKRLKRWKEMKVKMRRCEIKSVRKEKKATYFLEVVLQVRRKLSGYLRGT